MQVSKFIVLLTLAGGLAACAGPEVAPTVVEAPRGYARGIDMAIDSSDVIGQLRGRPWLQFVARYYRDPASRFPALSPAEARRLSAAGVKIVAVWEWHSSTPSYFTYANGYNDALNASRQAGAVGQPRGSAIYFAVDFNARGGALSAVDQYFRGVNAGMAAAGAAYRVGVYGSGAVCAAMRGERLAQYTWLSGSSSWEGTAGYSDWNIRQAAAAQRFGNLSFDHDANEARSDYGGFRLDYADNPAAAIVSVASAAPAAAATALTTAVASVAPPPSSPPPPAPPAPPSPAFAAAVASLPSSAPRPVAAVTAPPPLSPPPVASAAPPRPKLSPEAAEVAAAAAAEPPARSRPTQVAAITPRAAEPEKSRAEPEKSRAERREHETEHGERGAGRHKTEVAVNSRAVAEAARHARGGTAGAHERTRGPAESRRSEERRAEEHRGEERGAHAPAAKVKPAHASEHAARHNPEPAKPHHPTR